MSYQVRYFSFNDGYHQEADDRMMEAGKPRAVENLRKLKNGALGMRLDYDSLGATVPSGNGVKLFDLAEFNGRLVGTGCVSSGSRPIDLYEFVNQPGFAWRPSDDDEQPRLCQATEIRNVGRMPSQGFSATVLDVGACGGLVMLGFANSTGTTIHVFNPATDATVLVQQVTAGSGPKIATVGTVFFISFKSTAGTGVDLYRYNPATDTALVALTAAFTAGATVNHHDMLADEAGTGFWIGIARNATPAVTLKRFDSSGAATHTITGPAVSLDHFAIYGQAARVHLLAVESDGQVDLYTYTLAGALENSSFGLASAAVTNRQPTIGLAGSGTNIVVLIHVPSGASPSIKMLGIVPSTHVVSVTRTWFNAGLASKPLRAAGTEFFGGFKLETGSSSGASSCFIGNIGIAQSVATEMVCAYTDKLVGSILDDSGNRMPQMVTDSSTGKSYWLRAVVDGDGRANPVVSEFVAGSTARRQTCVVGDLLYIAGGMLQVCDGRQLVEACYAEKPVILTATGTSGGGKPSGAIKQLVAVWESYDSKGKKVSSALSTVKEVTLGGSDTAISVAPSTPHSLRQNGTNARYGSAIKVVIYETLDTRGGEFTLFRSGSAIIDVGFGDTESITLTKSETSLEAQDVVYTQGDRGALTGPNPFDAPEPCHVLAPSADTILSGGCPEGSRVQESRPQFIGEELNWSDEIGYQVDSRGDILAVARSGQTRVLFTANEIFLLQGPGLDDIGTGDLGKPERVPGKIGIYGGKAGWCSLVETDKGHFFQGKSDMIYLLPLGGASLMPVGAAVRTLLSSYPNITSATYNAQAESVRFTCNNAGNTDAIVLTYDVTHEEWFVEGPFGTTITAGADYGGRFVILRSGVAYRQRTAHPPSAFIGNAWRGAALRPAGPGKMAKVNGIHFFGTYRGNSTLGCVVRFDGGATATGGNTETLTSRDISGLSDGDQVHHRFQVNQVRCENIMVDFTQVALSGAATAGTEYNFWALEFTATDVAALPAPTQMS
jgi:hypothetical protein